MVFIDVTGPAVINLIWKLIALVLLQNVATKSATTVNSKVVENCTKAKETAISDTYIAGFFTGIAVGILIIAFPLIAFLIYRTWRKNKARTLRTSSSGEEEDYMANNNALCDGKDGNSNYENNSLNLKVQNQKGNTILEGIERKIGHETNQNIYTTNKDKNKTHLLSVNDVILESYENEGDSRNEATKHSGTLTSQVPMLGDENVLKSRPGHVPNQINALDPQKRSRAHTYDALTCSKGFCHDSKSSTPFTARKGRRRMLADRYSPMPTRNCSNLQKWHSDPSLLTENGDFIADNTINQRSPEKQWQHKRSTTSLDILHHSTKERLCLNCSRAGLLGSPVIKRFPYEAKRISTNHLSPKSPRALHTNLEQRQRKHARSSPQSMDSSSRQERKKSAIWHSYPRRSRKRISANPAEIMTEEERMNHPCLTLKAHFSSEDSPLRRPSGTAQLENLCFNLELLTKRLVSGNNSTSEVETRHLSDNSKSMIPEVVVINENQ